MFKGRVRNMFTDQQILDAVEAADGVYAQAAQLLSDEKRRPVSRALVRYWHNQLRAKSAPAYERKLRRAAARTAKAPVRPSIKDPSREALFDTSSILNVPDLHAPYHHPDALDFLYHVKRVFQPTMTVHLGDEVDHHAMSFHDSDPNLLSAGPELAQARPVMRDLASLFPDLEVLHSNHGSLAFRRAKKYNIPVDYLKPYAEVLFPDPATRPNWTWSEHLKVVLPNGQKVMFKHGENMGSNLLDNAAHEGCNIVVGHWHSRFNIDYAASSERLYWGMYSGCLIDEKALAFEYAKNTKRRPILGCSVIIDGLPQLVPMRLTSSGAWVGRL